MIHEDIIFPNWRKQAAIKLIMSERIIIENNILSSKMHWMSSSGFHLLNPESGLAFSFGFRMVNTPDSNIEFIIVPHLLSVTWFLSLNAIVPKHFFIYNLVSISTDMFLYILATKLTKLFYR
jgi:hypothetical protein